MQLSDTAKSDITWWVQNAKSSPVNINIGKPHITLETDSSTQGWGATRGEAMCNGRWSQTEIFLHINVLELTAVLYGLQSLCMDVNNSHILVKSDNSTTVSYIQNMGGCKSKMCNDVARKIWMWCIPRNIWLTSAHIEGVANIIPDRLSRVFDDTTEWQLNPVIFKKITNNVFLPEIDLFASRLNRQVERYVSWQPDPEAFAIDAFTLNWGEFISYIFPTFSVLPQVLRKLEADLADAIIIAPLWTAQCWLAKLTRLLVRNPLILPRGRRQLRLPFDTEREHPMWRKMILMACHLSGRPLAPLEFRRKLKTSSMSHGEQTLKNNIKPICQGGDYFVVDEVLIPFDFL